jgi:hypothetical protein
VVFLTDQNAESFLRKDLGYYGKALPRSSWESTWKVECDAAASARVAGTPHYHHKLEILVELETHALTDSAHSDFLNRWAQSSRHRIQFCRHADEQSEEAAARSREDYDVLVRVCEPGVGMSSPLPDWKSWQSVPSFKMVVLADAKPSSHHEGWALRHRVHQMLSATTLRESASCFELDESLSRQVHGRQNWVLQQPKQLVHHGLEAEATEAGAGGLDEVYEIQSMSARIWPLDFGDAQNIHFAQRETIQQLDDELAQLGYRSKTEGRDKPTSIFQSLRKRLTSLFRSTSVC